jgi:hypothetical protein
MRNTQALQTKEVMSTSHQDQNIESALSQSNQNGLSQMPTDLVIQTAALMDYQSIMAYCKSSKQLHNLCKTDKFWNSLVKYVGLDKLDLPGWSAQRAFKAYSEIKERLRLESAAPTSSEDPRLSGYTKFDIIRRGPKVAIQSVFEKQIQTRNFMIGEWLAPPPFSICSLYNYGRHVPNMPCVDLPLPEVSAALRHAFFSMTRVLFLMEVATGNIRG